VSSGRTEALTIRVARGVVVGGTPIRCGVPKGRVVSERDVVEAEKFFEFFVFVGYSNFLLDGAGIGFF
jgi:hypothetical protein